MSPHRYVPQVRRRCPKCEGIYSTEHRCWLCGAVMDIDSDHPHPDTVNQIRNHQT